MYEWWYQDIADFVKNVWGPKAKWEGSAAMYFPAQDTYQDVEVDGSDIDSLWMEVFETIEEAEAIINKFKEHGMPREEGAQPSVELLLNWLNREGHIPAGNYRVLVHW